MVAGFGPGIDGGTTCICSSKSLDGADIAFFDVRVLVGLYLRSLWTLRFAMAAASFARASRSISGSISSSVLAPCPAPPREGRGAKNTAASKSWVNKVPRRRTAFLCPGSFTDTNSADSLRVTSPNSCNAATTSARFFTRPASTRAITIAVGADPDGQVKFPHPWPPQIPPGRTTRL